MGKLNDKYSAFRKYATFSREPFFEIAKKYSEDKQNILDIGAGQGKFADYLNRDDIYMVEGNPDSASQLSKKYSRITLIQLPAKLPFEDLSFDLIHCSHLVEHLWYDDLYIFLKEIDRLLRPNGILVISAPMLFSGFYNNLSHLKPYNPNVFIKYLVRGIGLSATHRMISGQYEKLELVWRYTFTNSDVPIWAKGQESNLFNKLLFGWHLLMNRMGFGRYEKSGFTLVLKKTDI